MREGHPAQTEAAAQKVSPKAFGRYAVRAVLGRGAFGTVYLGYDVYLNRKVAIKVPHLDRSA